jgi:hypothetical protein
LKVSHIQLEWLVVRRRIHTTDRGMTITFNYIQLSNFNLIFFADFAQILRGVSWKPLLTSPVVAASLTDSYYAADLIR